MRRHRFRVVGLIAALMAVALGATGCGDDSSGGLKPGPAIDVPESEFADMSSSADARLSVVDNTFEPRYVTVKVGTKVTWTNDGRNDHNIVASNDGGFPTATADKFKPGASYQVTFDKPGDYPYYCSIHGTPKNGQNGAIRVVAQ